MKITARQWADVYVREAKDADESSLPNITKAFVQILDERGERHKMKDIIRHIDAAWKDACGVANVQITSAHPLSKQALTRLQDLAQGASLTQTVNPELLGGAVIRIDDNIIDASLLGTLNRLRRTLTATS